MIYIALFIYILWFCGALIIMRIFKNYITENTKHRIWPVIIPTACFVTTIEILYLILYCIGISDLSVMGFATSVLFFTPLSVPMVLCMALSSLNVRIWKLLMIALPILISFNLLMAQNSQVYYELIINIISIDILCITLILTKNRLLSSRIRWIVYTTIWVVLLHDGNHSYNHMSFAIITAEIISTFLTLIILRCMGRCTDGEDYA